MGKYDPYHKWLGIPPHEQPPTHYRLLGIAAFTSDPDVIEHAAEKRIALLRSVPAGPDFKDAQRLLSAIAAARHCLLAPKHKHEYDRWLSDYIAGSATTSVPPLFPTPAPIKKPSLFSLQSFLLTMLLGPPFLVYLGIIAAALVSLVPESESSIDNLTIEYSEAQAAMRVAITFCGLLVLVWAGLRLINSLGSPDAPLHASRVYGILVIGLGVTCYGLFFRHDYFFSKQYYLSAPVREEPAPVIVSNGWRSWERWESWESIQARAKYREIARNTKYNEALNSFQKSVSLVGGVVLVLGVYALFSKQSRAQVVGLGACAIGLGIAAYPWLAFAPIHDKAVPATKAVVPTTPKKAGPYLHRP
jgi:hypothetical protein